MTPRDSLKRLYRVLQWSLVLIAIAGPPAHGQEVSELMPSSGVLLLHNGEILEGKISRVGDWYYIVLVGGEIRIRSDRVEFQCRSLEEGYLKKRALIRTDDVHDRVRLAQWCIRHGLAEQAGEELAAAATIDPRHPMLPLMQRQLEMATAPPVKPKAKEQTSSASPRPHGPTLEELDRLVRSMPPGTVEAFTRTIQPLLVNRCSAGACHGPLADAKPRFHPFRVGSPPNRRTTQRNLHAVLEFIDRNDPAASPLLTVPSRPHGKTAPLFAQGDSQSRLLAAWIQAIAGRTGDSPGPSSRPERVRKPHRPPIHAMTPPGSSSLPSASPEQASLNWPSPTRAGVKNGSTVEDKTRIEDPWVAFSDDVRENKRKSHGRFTPRDPFDPEIFNRMNK